MAEIYQHVLAQFDCQLIIIEVLLIHKNTTALDEEGTGRVLSVYEFIGFNSVK